MDRIIIIIALGLVFYLPTVLFEPKAQVEQNTAKESRVLEFFEAARANDTDSLSQGLEFCVPVDSRDEKGRTALLIATYANAIDAARILIAAGADVNAIDHQKDSPYLYAGAEGRFEILKMTVAAGANLRSVNR